MGEEPGNNSRAQQVPSELLARMLLGVAQCTGQPPPPEAPLTVCEKKAHDMAPDKQEALIYGSGQMITVHQL